MPLEDVLTIDAGIRGPAQVAVKLAKAVRRKRNPIVDVLIVTRDSNRKLGAAWSTMPITEVEELRKFIRLVLDDQSRLEWTGELDAGEYDEDD